MTRVALRALVALLLCLCATPGQAEFGDIVFTRKSQDMPEIPPAVFPHYLHRMQFRCYVCHDAIFEMKAGASSPTMEAIQAGKFCGTCHNGVRAFQPTFDTCVRCHRS
jgi:c(7)-type cytochrome triheme protein